MPPAALRVTSVSGAPRLTEWFESGLLNLGGAKALLWDSTSRCQRQARDSNRH